MTPKTQLQTLPQILTLTKTQLNITVLDLDSGLSPLEEYSALYKLNYLTEQRMKYIKEKAQDDFLTRTGGDIKASFNGFDMSVKHTKEMEYTAEVTRLENEIKKLQAELKARKAYEKGTGEAKIVSNKHILSLEMK